MRVAIRADASVELGAGHVMRCLTLADALTGQGAHCLFLCRNLPGNLGNLVLERGHRLAWLPESAADDAEACGLLMAGEAAWDWLVVDHYGLDAAWERVLRPLAKRVLVLDDLANRPHECDLLLDQNLGQAGRYHDLLPPTCRSLLGPHYALLRPQFAVARPEQAKEVASVRRILIFAGGADAHGETLKLLAATARLGRDDLVVDVVIGQGNPHRAAIEAACQAQHAARLHVQVADMASRMLEADLFFGAGGVSSWERCCLGLPALVLANADNQIEQGRALAEAGAQIFLGVAANLDEVRLARQLECALENPDLLRHLAQQAWALVDGRGAERVARWMLAAAICLRPARDGDCDDLFAWRNHPDTRRYSLDPKPIDHGTHSRWLAGILADSARSLLIGEFGGKPIGVLRYDIEGSRARVSIYMVPGMSGKGWGAHLLLAGEDWLRAEHPQVGMIKAEIVSGNGASHGVFRTAGYLPQRTTYGKELHGQH